jgi:hypothetical protein
MRSCMTEIGNIQLLALCPSGVNPTSMEAVRAGKVRSADARAVIRDPQRQRALVRDPGMIDRMRSERIDREINSIAWILRHFEDDAKLLLEYADDLVKRRAVSVVVRQKLQNAIDDVIKNAKQARD